MSTRASSSKFVSNSYKSLSWLFQEICNVHVYLSWSFATVTYWLTHRTERNAQHVCLRWLCGSKRAISKRLTNSRTLLQFYKLNSMGYEDVNTTICEHSIQANFTFRERGKVAICFTVHCCCFRWQPRLMRGGGREGTEWKKENHIIKSNENVKFLAYR